MKIFGEKTLNINPKSLDQMNTRRLFLSIERFFENDIFILEDTERFLDNIEEKIDKFTYSYTKETNNENNTTIYQFDCFYDEIIFKIKVTLGEK